MQLFRNILIFLLFFSIINGKAQDEDSTITPIQMSLFYPIGTHGIEQHKHIYKTSLNSFVGLSKGIKGVELSGCVNYTNGDVKGTQMAGFINTVMGDYNGVQLAGFMNYNQQNLKGVQASGFTNITNNVDGIQLTGFLNVADTVKHQLSGFINIAKQVKGTQFAFINIADSVEGTSIGFLNIVKKGYKKIEIESGETFFLTVNGIMGTEKFYNFLTVGITPTKENFDWNFGYGFGFRTFKKGKTKMNIDLNFAQVNEGEIWTARMNMINQIKFKFSQEISNKIELYGGPTFTYSQQDRVDNNGHPLDDVLKTIPRFGVFQRKDNYYQHTVAIGFNFGIRF